MKVANSYEERTDPAAEACTSVILCYQPASLKRGELGEARLKIVIFIFLKYFLGSIFIRGREKPAYSYGAGTHGPSLDAELQHFSGRSHSKLSLPRVSSSRDGLSAAGGSLRTIGKSLKYLLIHFIVLTELCLVSLGRAAHFGTFVVHPSS